MKIIFAGGGTGGSVTPLISIYQAVAKRDPQATFLWLSPKKDPVKNLVLNYKLEVKEIFSGKLRRYFSWQNFTDIFAILFGLIQSIFIILKFKPDFIISAGGFVAVPVVWAAKILRVKVIIHQQDVVAGLANKLMASSAWKITVAFEKSIKDFPGKKPIFFGNPVREEIFSGNKDLAIKEFNLESNLPIVLIIGGGTGAFGLNDLAIKALPILINFCQIIHITGGRTKQEFKNPRYHDFVFLTDQLKNVLVAADLVVTRAGMGFLTELAALRKPVLIIPMPDSHQEKNAEEFFKNNAAQVLNEKTLTPEIFSQAIHDLLKDNVLLDNFRRNIQKVLPTDAAQKMVDIIYHK